MFQIEHNVGDVYDFETFLKPQYFKKIEKSAVSTLNLYEVVEWDKC